MQENSHEIKTSSHKGRSYLSDVELGMKAGLPKNKVEDVANIEIPTDVPVSLPYPTSFSMVDPYIPLPLQNLTDTDFSTDTPICTTDDDPDTLSEEISVRSSPSLEMAYHNRRSPALISDSVSSVDADALWEFYITSTARFCAVHMLPTPFVSSLVPMAISHPFLMSSLLHLSYIHQLKVFSFPEDNNARNELIISSLTGLRDALYDSTLSDSPAGLAKMSASLALATSYVVQNNLPLVEMHCVGATNVLRVIVSNLNGHRPSSELWFLTKWLTYTISLVTAGLLRDFTPSQPVIEGLDFLLSFWTTHWVEDPEANDAIDLFYGFSSHLTIVIIQILRCRFKRPSNDDLNALELALWKRQVENHYKRETSILKQKERYLVHCDEAFHAAAMLYFYIFLRPEKLESESEMLVSTIQMQVDMIDPNSRTAAALPFVMLMGSACAREDQYEYFVSRIKDIEMVCMTNIHPLLKVVSHIWSLRAQGFSVPDTFKALPDNLAYISLY
ncbi:hypothetical protein CANCADRAFT_4607 [Tortispora caseinolytica NRRL Y-17796]|uniref:Transcription factor domain-containing protein n=1 Tax=Tortispora caseinolytica NRRL Y-17796 TaxID=767744 RepID=A0A1E4T9L1_9ASCO|nr:hypothetical protein CANCADRAFT_4607 [Tortispora caseinolytica NRRL Y-17796]